MKLGVSYNLFDGYELLESSVSTMRPMVDHISVVFQETSNNGKNKIDKDIVLKLLNRLVVGGLIDTIIEFTPNHSKTVHQNEVDKRQTGYNKARDAECTHYLSMDVDEFYKEDKFNTAKKLIEDGGYDASIVEYVNYYGDFNNKMLTTKTYYVPFIYKIEGDRIFKVGNMLSNKFVCDPTRQTPSTKIVKFKPDDIVMHHMKFVRNGEIGMRMKFDNSSSRVNICNYDVINTMVEYYGKWVNGMRGMNIDYLYKGNIIVDNITIDSPLEWVDNKFEYVKSEEVVYTGESNE